VFLYSTAGYDEHDSSAGYDEHDSSADRRLSTL
jgi:hypothetical protein